MSVPRETGWLIEWRDGLGQTNWMRLYQPEDPKELPLFHCAGGTLNASEALRFARRCDARAFLHLVRATWPDAVVTDHEWINPEEMIDEAS
jgi:hypothetical protein